MQVVYEHMHRYLWAATVVAGRRVLDLGSGEGFGASILSAGEGTEVVGIDIDERTVEHAQLNWAGPRTSFKVGNAFDLSEFDDGSFGAVVAFEVIEHVEKQEQVLAEVARVLADDGVLIISTPDRRLYSDATEQVNPFHQHELTYEEFSALLEGPFPHVAVWGQRTITGSHLAALGFVRRGSLRHRVLHRARRRGVAYGERAGGPISGGVGIEGSTARCILVSRFLATVISNL